MGVKKDAVGPDLEVQVRRMALLRKELVEDDQWGKKKNKVLSAVIQSLSDQITGVWESIDHDIDLLGLMKEVALNYKNCTVQKPKDVVHLIEVLRGNKLARHLFGQDKMAELIQQFEVRVNGKIRTIRVQPHNLKWLQ